MDLFSEIVFLLPIGRGKGIVYYFVFGGLVGGGAGVTLGPQPCFKVFPLPPVFWEEFPVLLFAVIRSPFFVSYLSKKLYNSHRGDDL